MNSILNIQKPLIGLSPMDGITDNAYREIVKKYGNPDLIYTEFVNVMGLCIAGYNTLRELDFTENQRPILGQIYGKDPEYFYHAAKIICALGFDGVDINMGCPAKNVAQSGSGAALIRTPDLAREIISAVKEGVSHWVDNGQLTGLNNKTEQAVIGKIDQNKLAAKSKNITLDEKTSKGFLNLVSGNRYEIPTSVKTRIGYDKPITEEWIKNLDLAKPDWIAVHGRTLKQMYSGLADRNELKKAVESTNIPILVNGDILSIPEAYGVIEQTGAYGALIGKGSWGNPWVFDKNGKSKSIADSSGEKICSEEINERINVMIEHTRLFIQHNPDPKAFFQMRKHFGWYMKGFDGAKELREKLMKSNNLEDVVDSVSGSFKIISNLH